MADKPFAPACERNRQPILQVLVEHFVDRRRVLEIGSGTGQHAVYFAAALPHLIWQCSDQASYLPGIQQWLDEANLPNTPEPLVLDVSESPWIDGPFDAVFTANTLHIMSWPQVVQFFGGIDELLEADAQLVIYGPFNYNGRYTSESNEQFDEWLKSQAPHRAIRDFEAVNELAEQAGFCLIEDRAMPANNRCLVFSRGSSTD